MAKAQSIAGLDAGRPILENACLIIKTRLGEMLDYEPHLERVEHVYELHQMRIAAKRLRYSMEIFQPLYSDYTALGKEFEVARNEIKALQEHLGEIHDADVLVPTLQEHLARLLKKGHGLDRRGDLRAGVDLVDLDACQGLLTLCYQAREERAARYSRLLEDWRRLRAKNYFEKLELLLNTAAVSITVTPETQLPTEASA